MTGPVVALAAGCYVNTPPVSPTPEPGTSMVLELNDQGRAALSGNLGPEIAQVQGQLVRADTAYVLLVSRTRTLSRTAVPWAGETVSVSPQYVRQVMERRLSKPRTVLLTLGLAVTVGVFIASRHLLGFGSTSEPGGGPPDDQ